MIAEGNFDFDGDFVCVGLNHHQTPVEIREQIAFNHTNLDDALRSLLECNDIHEAAILSTCNRVELYAHGTPPKALYSLELFLHDYHRLPEPTLRPHLYRLSGISALTQLFRVTTSLDSLIVGEPQVLGQVKDAYARAHQVGGIGPLLTRAFSQAFLTAKRVRSETKIGSNAVTISFAAVELAQKVFGNLNNLSCLLVGAGEMSELAALHFKQKGACIVVVNRSLEHARQLAEKYAGNAYEMGDISALLKSADVVLTSTAASHTLITAELMRQVMRARRYRPIFLVDIAVPRNIEPNVSAIDGVYLYNIDDLGQVVAANFNERHKEAHIAETIIKEEIDAFSAKLSEQRVVPLILAMKEKASLIAEQELTRTMATLRSHLSLEDRHRIELMARSIVNKMLHTPITELKACAKQNACDDKLIELSEKLFGIEKIGTKE